MSRIIKCDRCGGEVEPKRIGYISMMERKEEDGSLTGTNPFEQMDFCENCMTLIADFISAKVATRAAKTKSSQGGGAASAGTKRRIDVGKIKALARAGWNQAKIADEMGCSIPTVAKYLKEESC